MGADEQPGMEEFKRKENKMDQKIKEHLNKRCKTMVGLFSLVMNLFPWTFGIILVNAFIGRGFL